MFVHTTTTSTLFWVCWDLKSLFPFDNSWFPDFLLDKGNHKFFCDVCTQDMQAAFVDMSWPKRTCWKSKSDSAVIIGPSSLLHATVNFLWGLTRKSGVSALHPAEGVTKSHQPLAKGKKWPCQKICHAKKGEKKRCAARATRKDREGDEIMTPRWDDGSSWWRLWRRRVFAIT